jgi:hypothetical protein
MLSDGNGRNWTKPLNRYSAKKKQTSRAQARRMLHGMGSDGMTLSEFLKILYKYYGNDGQTAAFVRYLFAAIDGDADDLFPMIIASEVLQRK